MTVASEKRLPTRYDRGAFCQVLATGIDDTGVVLFRAMPRHTLSDP
ncbi:hypothetical protein [Cupriavidus sp. L7L]|nr:hypothetical protein [Cupriavidus sp. L7L]